MIMDAILRFFGQIVGFIINLIPDAGSTTSASTALSTMESILANANGGSITGLANKSPIPLFLDLTWLTFFLGSAFAIISAFFIVKIIVFVWQQVKW